jgi:citrate lyase subunit beta / citryl-CoA lyase
MTTAPGLARSLLFVPGDRPDRFAKAHRAGADAVVIDLEDAVAPAARDDARRHVGEYLAAAAASSLVRLSASVGESSRADLTAVVGPGLAGVMVPKAEDPDVVRGLVDALPRGTPVVLLVETAAGVLAAAALARVPGVCRLALGAVDLETDTGISQDADVLRSVRVGLTLASRAAGLPGPIDGVCTDLADPSATASAALEASRTGFTGKLCIHPRQVAVVNTVFSPAADDVLRSRRIVSAAGEHGEGAFGLDGQMVDAPVIRRARAVLDAAAAFAASDTALRARAAETDTERGT